LRGSGKKERKLRLETSKGEKVGKSRIRLGGEGKSGEFRGRGEMCFTSRVIFWGKSILEGGSQKKLATGGEDAGPWLRRSQEDEPKRGLSVIPEGTIKE